MDTHGKVAVITGAGRGIGRACAERFLSDGYQVAVLDRDPWDPEDPLTELALALVCDVGDKAAVDAAFEVILQRWGRVDALVSNAAINLPGDFIDIPEAAFDETLRVNLKSVFLCGQAAARVMVEQGGGAIVNIASLGARMTNPMSASYAASKGGVVSLTGAMAVNLASRGVRVNAIAPGTIVTEMTQMRFLDDEVMLGNILSRTPLGRLGLPQDIAGVAAFLASDDAAFMTGETVHVDGGRSRLNLQLQG